METIYVPILAVILIYAIFIFRLKKQIGNNLFCELGFIYVSLIVLYTVLPGFVLIYGMMRPGDPIAVMLDKVSIKTYEISLHFWRHFLFILSFSAGYLIFRGREELISLEIKASNHSIIVLLTIIILICMLFLSSMSAPVTSYFDNYTRYEHLPSFLRKFASILIRFKTGFYVILVTLLFSNYQRYKRITPIIVMLICLYELLYSHGSRIYIFIILIQSFFLYNYYVSMINFKKLVLYASLLIIVFSSIEVLRLLDMNMKETKNVMSKEGIKPPGELGAIFMPGFHLYSERRNGTLPKTEWQMFFYDFISPFTFNSDTKWNPMYWYARNYFPQSIVPPFTLGPIADSAIWGGEIDLFFRGLINGAFFALIVRWFLKRRVKWWAVTIYTYFFSYSIITLKYSVFFYLTPLIKDLLPTLILVTILMEIKALTKNKPDNTVITPN